MPAYLPTLNWPIYSGWTAFTPTIPKMYWNVYSQEERIKDLCCQYKKAEMYLDFVAKMTNDWVGEYTDEVQAALDELERLLWDGIEEGVDKWISEHMEYIYNHTIKQIYFGLTLDGYLVAYIPDSWDDITFDTIMNFSDPNYGCLTLSY